MKCTKIQIFLWLFLFSFLPLGLGQVSRRSPVVEVVERVGPAIVNISTEQLVGKSYSSFFEDFYGKRPFTEYETLSLGSGLIVDSQGFIVTNSHVIRQASKIHVILSSKKKFEATLVAMDSKNDLALLKIECEEPLPSIVWADSSEILIGETAIALGNPFGLQNSVTTGVVSAINRSIVLENQFIFHDFIQTDAAINPGNSGGALLNVNGEVMGINTAIYSKGQGVGFAIPSRRVRQVMGRLLNYTTMKGIWLGLEVEEMAGPGMEWSVKVAHVNPNSPAEKAGIKKGEIIHAVDSQTIHCLFDFKKIMYFKKAGDVVVLNLSYSQDSREVSIQIASTPPQMQQYVVWNKIGLMVIEHPSGLLITLVHAKGPAHRIGIKKGDIIESLGGYAIRDLETLNQIAKEWKKGEVVAIVLIRNGRKLGGRLLVE